MKHGKIMSNVVFNLVPIRFLRIPNWPFKRRNAHVTTTLAVDMKNAIPRVVVPPLENSFINSPSGRYAESPKCTLALVVHQQTITLKQSGIAPSLNPWLMKEFSHIWWTLPGHFTNILKKQ